MPFLEVSFELGTLDAQVIEARCGECGAIAVSFVDGGDEPVLEPLPGEFRLWSVTRVQALFPGEATARAIAGTLVKTLGIDPAAIQARLIPDKIWEREWLKDFHAMRFGRRLWVCPWHETVDDPEAVVVRLDPGLAFGTGSHPTTALCLTWLDRHLAPGICVIDYGCGSGILALAALKLGASHAFCFDIDPQALIATHDNLAANGVLERATICASAEQLPRDVDLLMSNILASPLVALAPDFAQRVRPDGQLLLAGLMTHEASEVTGAHDAWFDMHTDGQRADWVTLSGRRKHIDSCSPFAQSAPSR